MGMGAALAAVGAHKLLGELVPVSEPEVLPAVLGEYNDYASFSTLAAENPEIAGWVSYRFAFTTTLPPDAVCRMRWIDSVERVS